jgi:hypothetical protein
MISNKQLVILYAAISALIAIIALVGLIAGVRASGVFGVAMSSLAFLSLALGYFFGNRRKQ